MKAASSSEPGLHQATLAASSQRSGALAAGFSQGRAEGVIAVGRLVFVATGFAAMYLEPSEAPKYAALTYGLITLYAVYSAAICLVAAAQSLWLVRAGLLFHVADLIMCTLLVYLTEGPLSSTFSTYFVFPVLAGLVRWQQRGALWTGAVSLALFGIVTAAGLGMSAALHRFAVRGGYLIVLTAVLAYLGRYELSNRDDLLRLALCPTRMPLSLEPLVSGLLDYAASIVPAPRIVMVWEQGEEPFVHLADWQRGHTTVVRRPPGTFASIVAGRPSDCDFVRRGRQDVGMADGAFTSLRAGAVSVNRDFATEFALRDFVAVRLDGEYTTGRLFFLDKPGMSVDDLALGTLVARQISDRMDHHHLTARLRTTSAREERIRVKRDIHDSVLQTLTALALQLKAIHRMMFTDPHRAAQRVAELERLTAREQFNIRLTVSAPNPVSSRLVHRLRDLTAMVASEWSLAVDLAGDEGCADVLDTLTPQTQDQIYNLTREALINAARHSGASEVRVELAVKDGMATVVASDNGRGFPFMGTYRLTELTKLGIGPVSLKQRISELRGDLALTSSPQGATVRMSVPAVGRRL